MKGHDAPKLWSSTKLLSLPQELSMADVYPWMLSLFPRRGRLQRTVYTSKITFKSSLVPEGAVGSSYARARNPGLSKSWTLRDKIIVPDECRSPRVTSPVMLIIERWYFYSAIPLFGSRLSSLWWRPDDCIQFMDGWYSLGSSWSLLVLGESLKHASLHCIASKKNA